MARYCQTDRMSTSTISTSTGCSNTSSLSLKGPGTGLADDSNELNLFPEDFVETAELQSSMMISPPPRLMLQLIGVVEQAVMPYAQLKAFWLDELAACFLRMKQTNLTLVATHLNQDLVVEGENLIYWMGTRTLRDFQVFYLFN